MKNIIGVRFRRLGKIYFFNPQYLIIKKGEYVIVETSDGDIIEGGYLYSQRIDLGYDEIFKDDSYLTGITIKLDHNGNIKWGGIIDNASNDYTCLVSESVDGGIFVANDGKILKINAEIGVPEVQELVVENQIKEFEITTDVIEIDDIKGGSISGEDEEPYETVKYGDSSLKEIKMTPDSGYEIIKITINGEEILDYEVNPDDGSYILPQFTNITEDKHIEVTYALSTNKITLNKVDSGSQEPLQGATFKLDQLEERAEPNEEEIFGNIVANGETYYELNIENEITTEGVIGELTNNGTYYFVQNADGSYVPTNSKTYQLENGGTAGVKSTTANSYVEIDLSDLEGEYVAVVNASISSEGVDYGYATINQNTAAPMYSTSSGRFMYISGTADSADYTSSVLTGGNIYYLHLGYRKDRSGDTGDDQVVINSIK